MLYPVVAFSAAVSSSDRSSYRRRFETVRSAIPTHVVKPSVSRAVTLHGTAFTVRVETPSGALTFKPGPVLDCGNGPVEYGFGGVPGAVYAPV